MKISFSNLLFAIAILCNVWELNTSKSGEVPSPTEELQKSVRPRESVSPRRPEEVQVQVQPQGLQTDQDQLRVANLNEELNPTSPGGASSGGERRKRRRPQGSLTTRKPGQMIGRPRGTHLNKDQFQVADPHDGPPDRIVHFDGVEIKVWLNGASVRKSIYPGNYIPQGRFYFHKFLIRTLERGGVSLVAYINAHNKLIGVRPPSPTGQGFNLEPSASEWFINYATTYLKVEVTNSAPTAMSLLPRNQHVPAQHSVGLETVSGITFRLFRQYPSFEITGVEFVSASGIAP